MLHCTTHSCTCACCTEFGCSAYPVPGVNWCSLAAENGVVTWAKHRADDQPVTTLRILTEGLDLGHRGWLVI